MLICRVDHHLDAGGKQVRHTLHTVYKALGGIKTDEPMKFDWALVSKEPLPESLGQTLDSQNGALMEWALNHGFPPDAVRRRTLAEAMYDLENSADPIYQNASELLEGVASDGSPLTVAVISPKQLASMQPRLDIIDRTFANAQHGVCPNL
jgi:hypothetical protein